ncbi:MAG: hypothetical protein K2K19_03660, partial [Acetatifactor sp.]|nr:hypothetical protein [Acetatifactor sp.]
SPAPVYRSLPGLLPWQELLPEYYIFSFSYFLFLSLQHSAWINLSHTQAKPLYHILQKSQ